MAKLTLDDFKRLGVEHLAKDVDIPELGGVVKLRPLSARESTEISELPQNVSSAAKVARAVSLAMVDPKVSEEDVLNLPPNTVLAINKAIEALGGADKTPDEVEKNS